MALNHAQFAEHLADLEARTGLQYHPGGMTLPSGLRVPAMHTLANYPNEQGTRIHEVRSLLPGETGALHSIAVRPFDDPEDFLLEHYSVPSMLRTERPELVDSNVLYSQSAGGGRGSKAGGLGKYHDSPGSWGESVEQSLGSAQPPTGEEQERAMRLIGVNSERTRGGQILPVHMGGYHEDFDLRSR
jgi:hypothetical protein